MRFIFLLMSLILFCSAFAKAENEEPPSYKIAEKNWQEARDHYYREAHFTLRNIEQRMDEQMKRLDHGDPKLRDEIYQNLKDLTRARDKIKRRIGMAQLVTITLWDDKKKEVQNKIKDITRR